MTGWSHDVIYALRSFRRAPSLFAGLIVVLGLGTGANAAIFSLVQAVLLQPLPYERPEDLVMVWNARQTAENWRAHATKETVLAWRDSSADVLSDVAVIKLSDGSREASIDLVLDDRAERLRGGLVTSNFFRTLGVSALVGRVFSPDDEARGDTAVVVLSDALWRRAFGANPSVAGRHITLTTGNGRQRRPRSYLVLGRSAEPVADAGQHVRVLRSICRVDVPMLDRPSRSASRKTCRTLPIAAESWTGVAEQSHSR